MLRAVSHRNRHFRFILIFGLILTESIFAQSILVPSLIKAPEIDGNLNDWSSIPATVVSLKKTRSDGVVDVKNIAVKGGTFGNRVYFAIEWEDKSHNVIHKPWVWSDTSKKYVKGPQREDRLAIQFAMSEHYSTNWLSGKEFTADTWHWKASRSNPIGLAHDKSLTVSRGKLLRAYKLAMQDGGSIYISRPSDTGDKLYKTKRYRKYNQQIMPSYIVADSPQGSVADVAALGTWSEGKWHLELSRKLMTGNSDDVELPLTSGVIQGGFAVFDQSENDDHAISDTVTSEFMHQPLEQ